MMMSNGASESRSDTELVITKKKHATKPKSIQVGFMTHRHHAKSWKVEVAPHWEQERKNEQRRWWSC